MKKLYSLVATAMISISAFAQSTIYSENLGAGSSSNPLVTAYTGWQNSSPISYSGTTDVRNNSVSSGYAGASGGANILFNSTSDTFIISGINTSTYSNIQLSFGHVKTTLASSNELTVSVSSDGTTWTPLTYTRESGSGTANSWALITPSGTIPAVNNLYVKFDGVQVPSNTQMRIDDIKIVGTSASLATNEIKSGKSSFIKNTVVNNDITFGAKSEVKVYNMAGQVVKTASVSENQSLNVSDLKEGTYIVAGTVNGQLVSEKIIKK
ncbi:T9SS type A sorting domain-containing protein [Chryseobacterium sp. C39-AII1]|uniref:T9SS type A sorting domain-containing protein n=1 Tax=Chryseobacterium sp. C39-AII1 TaxID=3080332 RepID=UPI003208868B